MSSIDSLTAAALALGFFYGVTGQLSGFCLLSGLRRWWQARDAGMAAAFALAAAVAIIGTAMLSITGLVDPGASIYRSKSLSLPVILVGGLLFGYGMALANGCGARALVLLGRGNLRSFVVLTALVLGAQMTLKGVLAPWRQAAQQAWPTPVGGTSVAHWLGGFGLSPEMATAVAAIGIAVLLVAVTLFRVPLAPNRVPLIGGFVIGLLIVAGWFISGVIGKDDFEPAPIASLSFVAPVADAVLGLMLSTGGVARGIGIPVVAAVPIGAFVAAALTGGLQWEVFATPTRMLRAIAGGLLMGVGGVMALGCSIGQGLSGVSTLALASFVAIAAIIAGARLGLIGHLQRV